MYLRYNADVIVSQEEESAREDAASTCSADNWVQRPPRKPILIPPPTTNTTTRCTASAIEPDVWIRYSLQIIMNDTQGQRQIDPDITTHPTAAIVSQCDKPTTTANTTSESSGYNIESNSTALRTAAPPTHKATKRRYVK